MDRETPETPRTRRVADRIAQVLAEILERRTEDPRLRGLTVTGARVSRDLGAARVWITGGFTPADEPKVLAGLAHATPRFRSMLAPELGLRIVPSLQFVIDHSSATGARIEELLRDLAREREAPAPPDAGDETTPTREE
jgi:ribosome-binding factor A